MSFNNSFYSVPKCYCKVANGDVNNNGIMCKSNGVFKETTNCSSEEWCTGPSTEDLAIPLLNTDQLCTKGSNVLIVRKCIITINDFRRKIH